ncbi:MAG: transcription repressor NadR [Ruminococcaceae bacterium]|nr:transcription repressor NadR [Oscillospiraceae bacterium]
MKGQERRENILKLLKSADGPVSAGSMAELYGVSRQIIVSDIARLRDKGIAISSLSRGYVLEQKPRCEKVFKVIHSDEDSEKELNLIVELNGEVKDVFVYHKFYGIVSAKMDIKTKKDIKLYLSNIASGKSSHLKNVTSGYHYHTVTADSDEILEEIEEKLWENGFLAKLKEYEPREIKAE